MRTTYKPRVAPYQLARRKALDMSAKEHPVRKELQRLMGTSIDLSVSFEEDNEAMSLLRHIPGIVPLRCIIRRNGEVVGLGRGTAIMTRLNRSIERSLNAAFGGAFLSAANSACKVLEAMRLEEPRGEDMGDAPQEVQTMITERQKSYLLELINQNVDGDDEREKWIANMDSFTKSDASEYIQQFAGAR